jgi:serine/threonine-protein kinase HipA
VLGRYPADKYALTTEQVLRGLASATDVPIVAARTYLRWVAFAYVTCNGDLHAKNLSVAEQPGGVVLPSPAYDLPSTYPYGDATMAMPVAGKDRENIGRDDFLKLAGVLGVSDRAAGKVIDDIAIAVNGWIDSRPEVGFNGRVTAKWRRAVEYRARRLA